MKNSTLSRRISLPFKSVTKQLLSGLLMLLGLLLWGSQSVSAQSCAPPDYNIVANKQTIAFSSTMGLGGGSFANMSDGVGGGQQGVWWRRNFNVVNQEVLKMVFPSPTALIGFEFANSYFLDNGVNYRIEGSNDGTNWIDLTGTQVFSRTTGPSIYVSGETTYKFLIPGNTTSYTQYRIWGLTGQTDWNWVSEIYIGTGPLSGGLSNIGCTYGADISTTADDELTFDLSPQLPTPSGAYTVSTSAGAPTPSGGTSGTTTTFTLPPGSVGVGDITVTITDVAAACTVTEVIPNQTPVPFTDTDEDGVGDKEDLDVDNDGILNTVEDSYCIDAACDQDNDGLRNSFDLDSDGDGIPDNIEAQTTAGYLSPNPDSPVTYASNNGVNSAYLGGLGVEDTDMDLTPDFLDLDSDDDLNYTDREESGLPGSGAGATYTDVNGTVNDPNTDLAHVTTTTTEADYRDKAPPIPIKVCHTSNRYNLNGNFFTFADDKLLNPANFGDNGVSRFVFTLHNFGTGAITEAALIANGCQIFQTSQENEFNATEHAEIGNWAQRMDHVLLTSQQNVVNIVGPEYPNSNGNTNPNSLTDVGENVVNGPFGDIPPFNQGGTYQGAFSSYPEEDACVIIEDAAMRPTGLLNRSTGDFYLADADLLSELGGLTSNNGISSSTDILFANLYHSMSRLIVEGPTNACDFFFCPAGEDAPVLTASSVSSAGLPVDLTVLYTGTPPAGATQTWHNASPPADENYIGNAASYTESGTVYAAFRAEDGSCYSPASPLMVTVNYPDLEVTIAPDTEASAQGETQVFTVTVTNNGPITAPNAEVSIPIPAQRQLVLANPSVGAYSGSTGIWSVGQLTNGQSETLAITIRLQ